MELKGASLTKSAAGYCERVAADGSVRARLRPSRNNVISMGDPNRINTMCAYSSREFRMALYFRTFRR